MDVSIVFSQINQNVFVYTICRQTQLSTRWYANLLNVNLNNYMFRPQNLAINRLYKRKLINYQFDDILYTHYILIYLTQNGDDAPQN